jgi:F-type H+-transporting ATPase subunit a
MSANQRGALIFFIIIVASAFFCYLLPFVILPGNGIGVALPVIQMPGEVYVQGWPSSGFQFTNTMAGTLLADFFLIVIALTVWRKSKGWTKEVPGRFQGFIESLAGFLYGLVRQMAGVRHIAKTQLFPLVASIFFFLLVANWLELIPGVDSVGILHCAGHSGEQKAYTRTEASAIPVDAYQLENTRTIFTGFIATEEDYHACEAVLHGEFHAPEVDTEGLDLEGPILFHTVEAGDTVASIADEYAELHVTTDDILDYNAGYTVDGELTEGERIKVADLVGARALNPDHNLFVVTPFFRAAATDLNLTFGLALISIIAIQYFGVAEQGVNYFQKFVNIHALGSLATKPMGAMDFGVGLFEIISEISKIISLAFRLFGNIFAGQLLLFIMSFLISTLLPGVFYGLEVIVGLMQALVFAALTLVFSAQAMEGHHGDVEHAD